MDTKMGKKRGSNDISTTADCNSRIMPKKNKMDVTNEMGWNSYAPNELGVGATYNLGISAVVPRPVAVITSIPNAQDLGDTSTSSSAEEEANHETTQEEKSPSHPDPMGVVNCAPFSYTGLLSHDPPMVAHGICLFTNKDGKRQKKDTLINIEQSKEWVFNVLTESYLEQANACSEALPYGDSEVEKNNLSTLPSRVCKTPRLAQALVSMECVLDSTKEVYNDKGEHTTTIVMGRIVQYHVHSSVLKDGDDKDARPVVDLKRLQSVGRAGDVTYWPTGDGKAVAMKRP